jgi:hypothetical protein
MLIRYSIFGGLLLSAATWLVASAKPTNISGTIAAQGQGKGGASAASDINYADMTRDLEIFRKCLAEQLSEKPGAPGASDPDRISYLGSSLFGASVDGYYVAGVGAVFVARTDIALIGPTSSGDAKEGKEPSLWDRMQAEVDGNATPGHSRGWSYDSAAVEAIKDKVLKVVGDFGSKIGQISNNEKIIVILRSNQDGYRVARMKPNNKGELVSEVVTANKGDAPMVYSGNYNDLASWVTAGGRTILTMAAGRGDCAAASDKKLEFEEFKSRVKIAQYFQPNSTSSFGYTLRAPK